MEYVVRLVVGSWLGAHPAAIASNFLGGVDVTEFFTQPPPLRGQKDLRAAKELEKEKQRFYYTVLFGFVLFILAIFILIAWGKL